MLQDRLAPWESLMDLWCSQMQPVLTVVRSDNKRGTPQFTAFASVFMLCSQPTPSFLFQHWLWFEDHIIALCCSAIFLYSTSKILLQLAIISFVDRSIAFRNPCYTGYLETEINTHIESLVWYTQPTFSNWVSRTFTETKARADYRDELQKCVLFNSTVSGI